jgi:hypothetical protein
MTVPPLFNQTLPPPQRPSAALCGESLRSAPGIWSEAEKAALRDEFFGFWPEDKFVDADGNARVSMLREIFAELERLTPALAHRVIVGIAKERSGIPMLDVVTARVESALGVGCVVAGPGAWKPPVDTPDEVERSERIRQWAEGLSDEECRRLAREAVVRRICPAKFVDGRDLRESPLGCAILCSAAHWSKPELLPLSLREDVDTRGMGRKTEPRAKARGERRTA